MFSGLLTSIIAGNNWILNCHDRKTVNTKMN